MEPEQKPHQNYFDKRRAMVIKMNQQRREQVFERTRQLFQAKQAPEVESDQEIESSSSSFPIQQLNIKMSKMSTEKNQTMAVQNAHKKYRRGKEQRKTQARFAKKFQVPDWLNSIPNNFNEFCVAVKPDAKKVLVIFRGNHAQARDKLGVVVEHIKIKTHHFQNTILEGYIDSENKRLFISDLISWKGNSMTANQFLFRYNWLQSNLILASLTTQFQVRILEYFKNSLENLKHLYEDDLGYQKDGLLFVHQDSFYEHGHNPNVLRWKDARISKFPFDQEGMQGEVTPFVKVMGKLAKSGAIYTEDGIRFIQLDQGQTQKRRGHVKFAFKDLKIEETIDQQIRVVCENVELLGLSGGNRTHADPLSKMIFQYKMRHDPLRIESIVDALRKLVQ